MEGRRRRKEGWKLKELGKGEGKRREAKTVRKREIESEGGRKR